MIISRPVSPSHQQLQLFDRPIKSIASARTSVGSFYEDLTARVLGGQRHVCSSSSEYCPDVSIGEHIYLECKSVGFTSKVIIYHGRLDKDFDFSTTHLLFYAVWRHAVRVKPYQTVEDLHAALLIGTQWLAIVPFDEIWRLAHEQKLVKLNSKSNYITGYQIPIKHIEKWKFMEWRYAGENHLSLPRQKFSRKGRQVGVPVEADAAQEVI
jgi:hypothetical protein